LAIEWTDAVPARRALNRINRVVDFIDHDAPRMTEDGFLGFWRHPIVHPVVLTAAIHALGWPTTWRWLPDRDGRFWSGDDDPYEAIDDAPEIASDPSWLEDVRPWEVCWLRRLSRSIDAWLPSEGPRPPNGRRRFGRRRGVRWMRDSNRGRVHR